MTLGKAIQTLRKHKGMHSFQLAKKIGMSANTISNIENDLTFPRIQTLEKICEGLEVSLALLLVFTIEETDVSEPARIAFKALHYEMLKLLAPH